MPGLYAAVRLTRAGRNGLGCDGEGWSPGFSRGDARKNDARGNDAREQHPREHHACDNIQRDRACGRPTG